MALIRNWDSCVKSAVILLKLWKYDFSQSNNYIKFPKSYVFENLCQYAWKKIETDREFKNNDEKILEIVKTVLRILERPYQTTKSNHKNCNTKIVMIPPPCFIDENKIKSKYRENNEPLIVICPVTGDNLLSVYKQHIQLGKAAHYTLQNFEKNMYDLTQRSVDMYSQNNNNQFNLNQEISISNRQTSIQPPLNIQQNSVPQNILSMTENENITIIQNQSVNKNNQNDVNLSMKNPFEINKKDESNDNSIKHNNVNDNDNGDNNKLEPGVVLRMDGGWNCIFCKKYLQNENNKIAHLKVKKTNKTNEKKNVFSKYFILFAIV